MEPRKRRVLEALIEDYIRTAEPIGSRVLVRHHDLGYSPATIRNEMADLAGLGYLEQPHVSAGRIPSDKGYRYYVDELLKPAHVNQKVFETVRGTYHARARGGRWLVHETARLVSTITGYPTLVYGPYMDQGVFQDLTLVDLGEGTGLLVLRTDSGVIETRAVEIPVEANAAELEHMARDFTQRFRGAPLAELAERMHDGLAGDLKRFQGFLQDTLNWLDAKVEQWAISGAVNMLNFPEFRDVDKAHRVLGFLDRQSALQSLLRGPLDDGGVVVRIGAEVTEMTGGDDLRDCSVVTAQVSVGGEVTGKVVVIGPRRMHYDSVISVLNMVAEELAHMRWA